MYGVIRFRNVCETCSLVKWFALNAFRSHSGSNCIDAVDGYERGANWLDRFTYFDGPEFNMYGGDIGMFEWRTRWKS